MTYATCGITLDSAVSIPELGHADRPGADCRFHVVPEQGLPAEPSSWIGERKLANGQTWLSIARHPRGYLLRFPSVADFHVTGAGRDISCTPAPGTPMETIRHLLLDQVLPLVLTMLGRLVLHAGAVEVEGEAHIFLGPSGVGKSTLVGALCQRGGRVLADDCVVIDMKDGHPWAVPSYAGLRLWPSSVSALYHEGAESGAVAHYTEKRRVAPAEGRLPYTSQAVPITGMYWLDPVEPSPASRGGRAAVVPIRGREACMALVKSAFQLDITDPAATRRSFEQVSHLALTCAISRLEYAKDFSHLQDVVDTVLADHNG